MNTRPDQTTDPPEPRTDNPLEQSPALSNQQPGIGPILDELTEGTVSRRTFFSYEVIMSIALWLFSIFAVAVIPAAGAISYILIRYGKGVNVNAIMTADPTVLLVTVIGVIPAHILTFGLAWSIVTRRGQRPFWRSIGWSFSPKLGLMWCIGVALGLYVIGTVVAKLIGGGPTDIDVLANSSLAVRILLALVATASGPLVEEVVYRGIIYPSLEKVLGMPMAVAIVSFLFAFVHLFQYRNNGGVIVVIVMLSVSLTLVRAFTGRLLPCFIIHMVFNGIVSVLIIFQPYFAQFEKGAQPKTSLVMFWRLLRLYT